MLKRLSIPVIALALLLMLCPVQANARVHWGVYVGPTYPAYPYVAPYPYYPYSNYYVAPYQAYPYAPAYAYPYGGYGYGLGFTWGGHHYHHDYGHYGHAYYGHGHEGHHHH